MEMTDNHWFFIVKEINTHMYLKWIVIVVWNNYDTSTTYIYLKIDNRHNKHKCFNVPHTFTCSCF